MKAVKGNLLFIMAMKMTPMIRLVEMLKTANSVCGDSGVGGSSLGCFSKTPFQEKIGR